MKPASSSTRLPSALRVILSLAVAGFPKLRPTSTSLTESGAILPCQRRDVKNKARPQILQANTQLSKISLCSRSQGQAGMESWHGVRPARPARPQQHLGLSSPCLPFFFLLLSLRAPLPGPLKAPLGSSLLLLLNAARLVLQKAEPETRVWCMWFIWEII